MIASTWRPSIASIRAMATPAARRARALRAAWAARTGAGAAAGEGPLDLERLGQGPVLLQLFVRGNPFRGSAGGQEPWPAVLNQLQAAGRLAGLAIYGSPYLWESLRPLLAEGIPAAWSPGQMPLAQARVLASLGLEPAVAALASTSSAAPTHTKDPTSGQPGKPGRREFTD
jgi:beta-glucosidase